MSKMILCTDSKGGIGLNNTIPWHSAADFKHFKAETTGKIVIMGYNTWKSLPKRPLPGRLNIVLLTRQYHDREEVDKDPSVLFVHFTSLPDILEQNPDAVVIGGSRIYELAIGHVDEIILSTIPGDYNCDTFFDITKYDYTTFKIRETKELEDGVIVEYIEIALRNVWSDD